MTRKTLCWYGRVVGAGLLTVAIQAVNVTLAEPAWAASGTVTGTLVDNGEIQRNLAVTVIDGGGATVATGVTDEDGKFFITAEGIIPGATYNVCTSVACAPSVATTLAAAAIAESATLLAVGIGIVGATGVAVGLNEATGGGGTEVPVSASR